ncbi:MAG: FAD-dependent oxidoreductase [Verrucomicrobia bacterium]|nr:FAD-dependent oxidoreductase [Verrucomicrobiota bacterium]MBV9673429.1 FAD-dependent oxidoreductase [Verrucomicrobiota bacterium]
MRIIIIGSGIMGASAAFHLTKLGAEVCVIDRNDPGRATFAGAGIICPWLSHSRDPRYQALAFASAEYYPELMDRLIAAGETNIRYDRVGGLVIGDSETQLNPVLKRLQAYLERGIQEVGEIKVLTIGKPKELFPYLNPALAGLYLSGAARVSGEDLRLALLNAAFRVGARQLHGSADLHLAGDVVVGVRFNREIIEADTVIVAAGAWAADLCRPIGLRVEVEPQRGQILHLKVAETGTEKLPLIIPVLSEYYLLGFPDSRVVVGATRETGSGFDFRVTAGGVGEILQEALHIAPGLKNATLAEVRVGFRPMTKDGLPLLGRPASLKGLVLATGLGRYGLTVGPFAGMLVAKLVMGEMTDIDMSSFAPDRQSS